MPEQRVRPDVGVEVEHLGEHGGGQHLGGRAGGRHPPVPQRDEPVRHPRGEAQLVEHGHHRHGLLVPVRAGEPAHQVQHLHLVGQVQVAGGLVQQQHGGALSEHERQPRALALAAGELGHLAVGELLEVRVPQRPGDRRVVVGPGRAEQPAVRVPAPLDELGHGHALGGHGVLGEQGHRAGVLPRGVGAQVPAEHLGGPAAQGQLPGEAAQQGRLAAAVRPDQRGHAAGGHVEVHGPHRVRGVRAAVAEPDAAQAQGRILGGARCRVRPGALRGRRGGMRGSHLRPSSRRAGRRGSAGSS